MDKGEEIGVNKKDASNLFKSAMRLSVFWVRCYNSKLTFTMPCKDYF